MDQVKREKLLSFISGIEGSEPARKAFLNDPIESLRTSLGVALPIKPADLPLANRIMAAALNKPAAVEEIRDIARQHQDNKIDLPAARKAIAASLVKNVPDDVRAEILQRWGQNPANVGNLDPVAIANLIVHVDVVVVITEALVIHSEYVVSGMQRATLSEVQRIAGVLAKG